MNETAERLGKNLKVPGFRPGHVPRKEVEKKVGPTKLLEESLEGIVRKCYVSVVMEEKLETIGSPAIDVKKLAPGNPLVFKITVSILPKITKLADYKSIKIERKPVDVTDQDVNLILSDLQKARASEVRVKRPINDKDRVVIDLDISQNRVRVEGGSTKNHVVLMDEPYYVPGFTDALKGLEEGQKKTFTLTFPEDHFQKTLAGKPIEFQVKVNEVYERTLPALDDELAKGLGKSSFKELSTVVRENITREKTMKEEARIEGELLQKLVEGSQFEDIPELLVNEEIMRMRSELERNVAAQGLEWNQYLAQIKKDEGQLKLDLAPEAIQRIKTTLAIHEAGKQEEIKIEAKEIDEELDKIAAQYKDDEETRKKIYSPEHRDQFTQVLKNKKTITRLKELAVK